MRADTKRAWEGGRMLLPSAAVCRATVSVIRNFSGPAHTSYIGRRQLMRG